MWNLRYIVQSHIHMIKEGIKIQKLYSYDQRRHNNSKGKYFDATFSNIPNDDGNISVNQKCNSKKENLDVANYNVHNVPVHRHCFLNLRKIDMGILVYLQHHSSNLMKVSV